MSAATPGWTISRMTESTNGWLSITLDLVSHARNFAGDGGNRRDSGPRTDLPRQAGRDQRHHAAGEKGELVAVQPIVHQAAARRHQRRAELVGEKEPAVHPGDRALAEGVRRERHRGRHRGEPVEAVDDGEKKK